MLICRVNVTEPWNSFYAAELFLFPIGAISEMAQAFRVNGFEVLDSSHAAEICALGCIDLSCGLELSK